MLSTANWCKLVAADGMGKHLHMINRLSVIVHQGWIKSLIGLVRLYQVVISCFLPPCCRFEPTCSHFAIEALQKHGGWRGSWLTIQRLCRCHPWHAGGVDQVPD